VKDNRRYCRAPVINLDFDGPLNGTVASDQVKFEDLQIVSKLAQLHALDTPVDWKLFITFNASITWSDDVARAVLGFIRENFEMLPSFREQCEFTLGARLVTLIDDGDPTQVKALEPEERQLLLMAFVPKKVAQLVYAQGWLVDTERSLRYGGESGTAHMVTWALSFRWDTRVSETPIAVYKDAVGQVLANAAKVTAKGEIA
jgi:hypothetical protein